MVTIVVQVRLLWPGGQTTGCQLHCRPWEGTPETDYDYDEFKENDNNNDENAKDDGNED